MAERFVTGTVSAPWVSGSRESTRFDPRIEERHVEADIWVSATTFTVRKKFVPFLLIDGVRIPVKIAEPTHQDVLIGSQRYTFDGTMRSGVRRRRRQFRIVTPLLPLRRAMELRDWLIRPPPLYAETALFTSGEGNVVIGPISGGYNRGGQVGGEDPLQGQTQLMSLEFTMMPE